MQGHATAFRLDPSHKDSFAMLYQSCSGHPIPNSIREAPLLSNKDEDHCEGRECGQPLLIPTHGALSGQKTFDSTIDD